MASVNKVIIVGHVGKDPEIKYLTSGDAVANLSIATTDKYKNKAGEQVEKTEWHRIVLFRTTAEIAGKYVKKGSQLYIEGKLQTREWEDKEGTKRYTTEIIADRMQMLGGNSKSDNTENHKKKANASGGLENMEDDIPF